MSKRPLMIVVIAIAAVVAAQAAQTNAGMFPDTFFKALPGLERFRSPDYHRVLAADGLRAADGKALFQRITAATEAGEGYKALYLSRLLTDLHPDNAIAWSNRAKLAANLGFAAEAVACQARAEGGTGTRVPPSALPGNLRTRPASLADWAAALALAGDDVAEQEGRPMVLAVRDDLSGLQIASPEEVAEMNEGPWATAKPVELEHILPNLFAMPDAEPMDKKSMKGGLFALGAAALITGTYAGSIGATDASLALAELYGSAMSKAFEVPSDFKDGQYSAVTYAGARKAAVVKPKTSGKRHAIGTPLPVLWASGRSLAPSIQAWWRNGDSDSTEAIKVDASTKKQELKKHKLQPMVFPRVQQLCVEPHRCSPPVTVFELMLTAEDLQALAPGTEAHLPDVSRFAAAYAAKQPIRVVNAGQKFAGFDAAGATFLVTHKPTEWLTTVPAGKPAKR